MLSPQSPRLIFRLIFSRCLKRRRRLTISPKNHAALHSFLSSVIEEFLVQNSFARPPPQVQPREESAQSPRKRRRLADHTVSVYSSGPSQQTYRTAELDYFSPEQELLQPSCSECSGSCDGCSSCCGECLYASEGNNPDPYLSQGAYYGDGQQVLGEHSLSDEVVYNQVSLNIRLPHECSSGLGR